MQLPLTDPDTLFEELLQDLRMIKKLMPPRAHSI
jgi:hypothetical protein